MDNITNEEYKSKFETGSSSNEKKKNENALTHALDIRKFEIELYWKRASYFWTFIAAIFAGFIAVQSSSTSQKDDLSVLLCNLGVVFSFAWFCVNRGSKYWQENWENHVDLLEDQINGPLYKVVISRRDPKGFSEWFLHLLVGPSSLSVSKINQLISLFITFVWIGLLIYSLPKFCFDCSINWYYFCLITISILVCISFIWTAKTSMGSFTHHATIRNSKIDNNA